MTKREVFENLLDKGATEYSICDIQEIKGFAYSFSLQLEEKDKEIEKLNKEIETLKQSQVFIDTQDMEERYAQGLYEDYIEAEYEKLIFDYLTNNCKEFDDEHIKKLVDLKVKQHLSSQKEIERLNNIINELEKWLEDKQELTCGCGITRDYMYAYENVLDYLNELKEGK